VAEDMIFLTLWVKPQQLREQFEKSTMQTHRDSGKTIMRKKQLSSAFKQSLRLQESYRDADKIVAYYRNWFAFCKTFSAQHFVVSLTNEIKLFTPEEWETFFAQQQD
jgi:hypothetical protein